MQIPGHHSLPSASCPQLQNRLIMAACLSGVKTLREGLGWGDCEGAAGAAGGEKLPAWSPRGALAGAITGKGQLDGAGLSRDRQSDKGKGPDGIWSTKPRGTFSQSPNLAFRFGADLALCHCPTRAFGERVNQYSWLNWFKLALKTWGWLVVSVLVRPVSGAAESRPCQYCQWM